MRNVSVFGLSASRGSGAVRHCDAGAKEAKAARCPKTGPPLKRAPTPTVRAPKYKMKLWVCKAPRKKGNYGNIAWFRKV